MKDNKINLELNREEVGLIINSLNELRNIKIKEEVNVDSINELLLKVIDKYEKKCPIKIFAGKDYAR